MDNIYEEAKASAGDLDEQDIQNIIDSGNQDPYFDNKST